MLGTLLKYYEKNINMKKSFFEKYALVMVLLWFVAIGLIAFIFTGCSAGTDKWNKSIVKVHVDSVKTIQPVSTLDFEPKYVMYLSNGTHVTVRNRHYAYSADSIELVYMKKVK